MNAATVIALIDLDDTILDYRREEDAAADHLRDQLSIARDVWDPAYRDAKVLERETRTYSGDPLLRRFELLADRLEILGAEPPELRQLYVAFRRRFVSLLPGARATLGELRRLVNLIYICTSGVGEVQRDRCRAAGLTPLVDGIAVSDDLGLEKSDWPGFLGSRYEPGAHYLVVSDQVEPDLIAAERLGMATISFGSLRPFDNHGGFVPRMHARSHNELALWLRGVESPALLRSWIQERN